MVSDEGSVTKSDAAKIAAEVAARYLPSTGHAWFDPFQNPTHFLIACGLIIALGLLIWYWRTLLDFISEDNVLRCDRFYLQYWLCLQCCGVCDGEWTRCVSSCCCCCCETLRGRNLKRCLGEWLGLSPVPVKVQNIMLGGLPRSTDGWFRRSPDIFLQITPDELQPTLNTEVITQANIDCVQFTSGFTLLIKNHIKEDPVRICVREMRMVGSRDIADCYISPTRLIAWANKKQKVRVRLSPLPGHNDAMRTPWILLDLSVPGEMKFLKTAAGSFSPVIVKTRSQGGSQNRDLLDPTLLEHGVGAAHSAGCMGGCVPKKSQSDPLVLLPVQSASDYRMYSKFDEFVDQFPLLNEKGLAVKEQEDLLGRDSMRFRGYVRTSLFFLILFVIVYIIGRFLSTTCYEEFRQLQVVWRFAQKSDVEFSTSGETYEKVREECQFARMDVSKFASSVLHHKGLDSVTKNWTANVRSSCNPTREETIKFCDNPPNVTINPQVFETLPCLPISCRIDVHLQDLDVGVFILCILWGLGVAIGQTCVDNRMRQALERPSVEAFQQIFDYLREGGSKQQPQSGEAVPEETLIRPTATSRRAGFGGAMG